MKKLSIDTGFFSRITGFFSKHTGFFSRLNFIPDFSREIPDFSLEIQSSKLDSSGVVCGPYVRKIMIIGDWRRRSTRKATKSHLPAIPDFSLECTGFFSRPLCVWMAYYGCHTGFFSRNTTFFSRNQEFTWFVQDSSRMFQLLTRGVQYVRPT